MIVGNLLETRLPPKKEMGSLGLLKVALDQVDERKGLIWYVTPVLSPSVSIPLLLSYVIC